MTIDTIKEELNNHIGKKAIIKYNLGRNKYEKYEVTIKELYSNVFLVEIMSNDYNTVKSFSYADVITKTIKIDFWCRLLEVIIAFLLIVLYNKGV